MLRIWQLDDNFECDSEANSAQLTFSRLEIIENGLASALIEINFPPDPISCWNNEFKKRRNSGS